LPVRWSSLRCGAVQADTHRDLGGLHEIGEHNVTARLASRRGRLLSSGPRSQIGNAQAPRATVRPDHRAEVVDEGVLAREHTGEHVQEEFEVLRRRMGHGQSFQLAGSFHHLDEILERPARVRWRDSPLTTPSQISRIGLIERSDPKKALAARSGPPFVRCP